MNDFAIPLHVAFMIAAIGMFSPKFGFVLLFVWVVIKGSAVG